MAKNVEISSFSPSGQRFRAMGRHFLWIFWPNGYGFLKIIIFLNDRTSLTNWWAEFVNVGVSGKTISNGS